ncbi:hypothetical protein [Cupriavidus metallidurans]|uniref:hypothetical protein n=1 Tax=Cupriavidus metallidurans TaxID=119219 RepID=UPI001CD01F5A|nr:hypothetical protein [Cupriavidus metallidurans]UBM09389.1 hypothetical protein LAI70_05715 [Cupriavidus metallidurans]
MTRQSATIVAAKPFGPVDRPETVRMVVVLGRFPLGKEPDGSGGVASTPAARAVPGVKPMPSRFEVRSAGVTLGFDRAQG